jgi:carbonic anhydrase
MIPNTGDHVELGNLTALLSKLQPAVYDEKTETENCHSGNDVFCGKSLGYKC